MSSFSRTAGNSDMGLSSEGGRALKPGSLRLARISAAWRAQRQRAATTSSMSCLETGEEGSVTFPFGDGIGEVGWRSAIFSW